MQFMPDTWASFDIDGDGSKNIQSTPDALRFRIRFERGPSRSVFKLRVVRLD